MARRRKGDKVDGWIVLDKPAGLTSTRAVGRVRRLFNAAKAGHAGTLDPLATGVLPIALGEATKTAPYVVGGDKTYRFTVRWGEGRSTDDADGEVIATSPVRPRRDQIERALGRFCGEIDQVPPPYSAIKEAGRPAYRRARAGEAVELAPRRVIIKRLQLLAVPGPDHAVFELECGKGTYVRSLARDLAKALGTLGYVAELRRLATGPFKENAAISLDKLEALGHSPARFGYLQAVETALDDIPALAMTEAECLRLRKGIAVRVPETADRTHARAFAEGEVVCATLHGRAVALVVVGLGEEGYALKPFRVFNIDSPP